MLLDVPPEAAGERLDAFLAQPLGSRSRAARLIAAELVLVDGAVARKRQPLRGGERIEVRDEPPPDSAPDRAAAVARFEVAFEDDHLIVVDKPAGVVVHPARGHREGTLAQALAGRIAGGERGLARGDRAPPGPRHLGPARRRQARRRAPRAEGGAGGARDPPRVPRARRGPAAGALGHDRGADRPRPARAHEDVDRHRRAEGGDHALRARARAAAGDAAARAPADRAHAPDPRAPAGDRPPGVRRPRLRHGRPVRPGAPVPARGAAGVRAPGDGRARSTSTSPLPQDLADALAAAASAKRARRCGGRPVQRPPRQPHIAERTHRR